MKKPIKRIFSNALKLTYYQKMRLTLMLFPFILSAMQAGIVSPTSEKVTVVVENMSVNEILNDIESNSYFNFIYKKKDIDLERKVTLQLEEEEIQTVLNTLFMGTGVEYLVEGFQVILRKGKDSRPSGSLQTVISGKIVDGDGLPISGANVLVKGIARGVLSDFDGNFSITASVGDVLVFSHIGFVTQEIRVDNDAQIIDMVMDTDVQNLNEVFVTAYTGYQTVTRERATGAFNVINKGIVKNTVTQSIGSILQGIAPGIQIFEDADGNINPEDIAIRGVGTINSSRQPLIVLDGFPIEGGFDFINPNDVESITILKDAAAASIWGARAGNGVIVITTKSKNFEPGFDIDFSTFVKFRGRVDLPYNLARPSAAAEVEWERRLAEIGGQRYRFPSLDNISPSSATVSTTAAIQAFALEEVNPQAGSALLQEFSNNNFYEDLNRYMLTNPINRQYNLSINSRSEKSATKFSLLYDNNIGAFIGAENNKLLLNLSQQYKISEWMDFDITGVYSRDIEKSRNVDLNILNSLSTYEKLLNEDGSYAPVVYTLGISPSLPIFVGQFGTLPGLDTGFWDFFIDNVSGIPVSDLNYNPLREARNTERETIRNLFRVNGALNIKLAQGINFKPSFQYENLNIYNSSFYGEESITNRASLVNAIDLNSFDPVNLTVGPSNLPQGDILEQGWTRAQTLTFRGIMDLNRTFWKKHRLSALLGAEYITSPTEGFNDVVYGYNAETATSIDPNTLARGSWTNFLTPADTRPIIKSGNRFASTDSRTASLFGNMSYTYDDKYILSGSVRRDGANVIVEDNRKRYDPMWSIGAKWNIGQESFMKKVDWVNQLDLRLTNGESGNIVNEAATRAVLVTFGFTNPFGDQQFFVQDFGNPDLRWERVNTLNAGVDFSILGNKIYGSVDYYDKRSYDLIAQVSTSETLGRSFAVFNVGEMENKGFEIELNALINFGKDFSWLTNAAFSYNDSEVTSLFLDFIAPDDITRFPYVEGNPFQPIYVYEYAGVADNPFDPELPPVGVIQGQDGEQYFMNQFIQNGADGRDVLKYAGTRVAPTVIGWNNNFYYKGFLLRTRLTGKFGHKFVRPTFETSFLNASQKYKTHEDLELVLSGRHEEAGLPPLVSEGADSSYGRYSRYLPFLDTLVEDAGHIRFREIYLAYDFPQTTLSKLGISNLRFFAQAENLGNIWTANSRGLDPEYLPQQTRRIEKAISLGLNVGF
ncbi:SusC/RagA family TonB-linked outer membrane protein [Flagellimonas hymeniacidonis]|uniref:SusC/RagA family TonB-linked outer membrane protein n=1 Tax=Flagellimonas hymeniacidonis TaxID=2603628 RepID=A0A5C8V3C5_9FLAO|nr:SusC/RagA family TonB-linked outer membrane protein [Flagellimonas hymeniacidonis]TXN34967.1 SusC/RagA family TonB-linked outer membrane protein [Flagellimonas hymeniacidonis]